MLPTLVHSSPSGQTTSIEGGGFCQGSYTGYNNTVDNLLYSMNCATGVNDCHGFTDLGSMWNSCVRGDMPQGGLFHLRNGYFSMVTAFTVSGCSTTYCSMGLQIEGSGTGHTNGLVSIASGEVNGTILVAKTNAMTMMQATTSSGSVTCATTCSGAPAIQTTLISGMTFYSNGLAKYGLDFRIGEVAALNTFSNLFFTNPGGAASQFTTDMLLDGNEDTFCNYCYFDGDGKLADRASLTDLQWQVPSGNVNIYGSFFGGQTSLKTAAQNINIVQSTFQSVQFTGPGSSSTQMITFIGDYLANQPASGGTYGSRFQINGQTINDVRLESDFILITPTMNWFSGTGTVVNFSSSASSWYFVNTITWNPNSATLTKQSCDGTNHVSTGTTPTGWPSSAGQCPIDGNGNF